MLAHYLPSCKAQRIMELKFAQMDLRTLASFRRDLMRIDQLKQLEQVTGLTDQDMLETLHGAGFRAETIEALTWLPIAMVAWASGSVSPSESNTATHCQQQMKGEQAAELFLQWLTEKPSQQLVELWESYVTHCVAMRGHDWGVQTGLIVGGIAQAVARASGGLIGFGAVCPAEQSWLDRINRVYGRPARLTIST